MRKALLILPAVAAALTLSACGGQSHDTPVTFYFKCQPAAGSAPNDPVPCTPTTDTRTGTYGGYSVVAVPFVCGPEWHNPTGYSDTVSCHSK
jgi:hypothetical protein